jgi:Flp pilus assembly protein TadG
MAEILDGRGRRSIKMARNHSSFTFRASERGHAAIEMAFVLPFLVLTVFGIWDLGRATFQYLNISRVAYEGTRFAAAVSQLEDQWCGGTGINSAPCAAVSAPLPEVDGAVPAGHQRVRERVSQVMARYGMHAQKLITKKDPDTNTVTVSLSVPFEPWFPAFSFLTTLGTEATGPYLFVNNS